jgi:hypothetical protein
VGITETENREVKVGAITTSVWPRGWVCQAVRAPGSNVIDALLARAGSVRSKRGSIRTLPVNQSAGPFPDGRVPMREISMCVLLEL